MNERQKNNLNSIDLEYGEGLFDSLSKIEATKEPVLIIGLGGLGCTTLNQVKKRVIQKMKHTNAIYYLAVDSADKDFNRIKKSKEQKDAMLEDGETFSIFDASIVNPNVFPENIERWKNPQLNLAITGDGCGGIRQQGRYLLTHPNIESNIRAKISGIITTIRREHDVALAADNAKINIIFIAGISGGTGSGTFVDMAYLVDDICNVDLNMELNTNYKISGYIFLPDVQRETGVGYLERNGYAALKELDYFMNIEQNGGSYDWPFEGKFKKVRHNIYNFCTVIGSSTVHGAVSMKQAVSTATEMIVSTISDAAYKEGDESVQLLSSFYDNSPASLQTWFTQKDGKDMRLYPRSNNYCYCLVGYGSAVIPVDEIMSYMAREMFDGVEEIWNNMDKVNNETVRDCLATAGLDGVDKLIGMIKREASLGIAFNPDSGILKPNNEKLMQELNAAVSNGQRAIDTAKHNMDQIVQAISEKITKTLITSFDSMFQKNGPYYTSYIITTRAAENGNKCDGIWTMLQKLNEALSGYEKQCALKYNDMHSLMLAIRSKSGDIERSGLLRSLDSDSVERYKNWAKGMLSRAVYDRELCDTARSIVNRIMDWLNKYNSSIFKTYTDVMDYVIGVLNKNADKAGATNREVVGNTTTFSVNIVDLAQDDKSVNHLRKTLDNIISAEYKKKFVGTFQMELCSPANRDAFTSTGDDFRAAEKIKEVFNNILGEFYNSAIEMFVIAYYSDEPFTADELTICMQTPEEKGKIVKKAATQIVDKLIAASEVMGKITGGRSLKNFSAARQYFVCPATLGPELVNALSDVISDKVPGVKICQTSNGCNIELVKNHFGIPLAYLTNMSRFDTSYTNAIEAADAGLHLNEAKGSEWASRLPAVYTKEMWSNDGDVHVNAMVEQSVKEIEALAEDAFEKGIIHISQNGNDYNMWGIGKIINQNGKVLFDQKDKYPADKKEALIDGVISAVAEKKEDFFLTNEASQLDISVNVKELRRFILDELIKQGQAYELPVVDASLNIPYAGISQASQDEDHSMLRIIMRKRVDDTEALRRFKEIFDEIEKKGYAIVDACIEDEILERQRVINLRKFNEDMIEFAQAIKYGIVRCERTPAGEADINRWEYDFQSEIRRLCIINPMRTFEATYYLYIVFRNYAALDDKVRAFIRERINVYFENNGVDEKGVAAAADAALIKKVLDDGAYLISAAAAEQSLNREYNKEDINGAAFQSADYFKLNILENETPYDILRKFYQEFNIK